MNERKTVITVLGIIALIIILFSAMLPEQSFSSTQMLNSKVDSIINHKQQVLDTLVFFD